MSLPGPRAPTKFFYAKTNSPQQRRYSCEPKIPALDRARATSASADRKRSPCKLRIWNCTFRIWKLTICKHRRHIRRIWKRKIWKRRICKRRIWKRRICKCRISKSRIWRRGTALVEIERIWRIRNKGKDLPATTGNWEFISFAEDYWTKKAKVSAGRLDAYRTNLASSTNQLLQLIGLFIVFQGVLLTACVQSARLTCKTYWFPLTLDIIATLCAIFGVWFKFKEIIVFEELEDEFNQEHKHTVSQLAELKDEPEKYDFQKHDPDLPARRYEFIIPILVEVAIGGFASVAMYLMHRVMCR